MNIRNHEIPREMIEVIESGLLHREVGSWQFKSECDSYGNKLEIELGEFFISENKITEASDQLNIDFSPDGDYGDSELAKYLGAIIDVVDFTDIICIGMSGDGSPFCLDYRSPPNVSVIWWDDIYWRKVSPNFKEFLALLELNC